MEQLRLPPITEALIDIQASFQAPLTPGIVENLHFKIINDYPKKEVRKKVEGRFEFGEGKIPKSEQIELIDGYLFWTVNKDQVAQFRLNGFALSRLNPYTGGDKLIAEAKRLWSIYKDNLKPIRVNRLAMRYINSIPLSAGANLSDYFPLVASIPDDAPFSVEHYFSRTTHKKEDVHIIITHASSKGGADKSNYVIDIDVYHECSLDPYGDELKMWEIIAKLRTIKNNVFDKYTSQLTKRMFQ